MENPLSSGLAESFVSGLKLQIKPIGGIAQRFDQEQCHTRALTLSEIEVLRYLCDVRSTFFEAGIQFFY